MTTATVTFPNQFEQLQKYSQWVLPTERDRIEARLTTNYDAEVEFYNEVLALMPEIMAYLKTKPIDSTEPADRTLMDLVKSFMEIANAVELYGEPQIPDGADLRLFISVLDRASG